MNKPKVSVVTVSYNAVSSIESTILSVINQTYSNIEYIIIDGGSRDGTVEIIKKYASRISYWISEPDKGIYDAMNKGIDKANGEWVNFMNAGDSFYEVSTIESFMDKVSLSADIAYGDTMILYSMGKVLEKAKPLNLIKERMVFGHQATFVKAYLLKQFKFDTSYRSSGDYHFFYQMYMKKYFFEYIPIVVANYDGRYGMSRDFILIVKKENARIHGKDNTILWSISFCIEAFVYKFKAILKFVLPERLVFYLQKKKIKKRG